MQPSHSCARATTRLSTLSDDTLLRELHTIVASHRRVTAALIEHLGEVDARRLHVDKGFSSLFSYCVKELSFSEDEACRRIDAARLALRFPAVLPLLETGAISLTVLGLLKPHLTGGNHRELLVLVSGASVRQAKEQLAALFPLPDVPSSIRKLPERLRLATPPRVLALVQSAPTRITGGPEPGSAQPAPARLPSGTEPKSGVQSAPTLVPNGTEAASGVQTAPSVFGEATVAFEPKRAQQARIDPLSSDRFLVKLTANRALRDKIELARDLMRRSNPSGDLAIVLERAVDLLIAELEKTRKGRTTRPCRKQRPARDTHVTRSARREVVARDGWRCSFVADDGRRCDARAFLEFDHETPKGRGGGSGPNNLRLLCRAHNRLAAERIYGKEHVALAISNHGGSND